MSVRLDCPLMARFKPQAPHPLQMAFGSATLQPVDRKG